MRFASRQVPCRRQPARNCVRGTLDLLLFYLRDLSDLGIWCENFAKDFRGLRARSCVRAIGRRRAFTFTEVLFAVVILGIGFVMVAALLPVAIQQTSQGVDQGSATAISAAALRLVAQAQTNQYCMFPPTEIKPTAAAPAGTSYATIPGKVYYFGDVTNPTVGSTGTASSTTPPTGTTPPIGPNIAYPGVTYDGTTYWLPHYFSITEFTWNSQFNTVKGNLISQDDPRYAWIAFYQRGWSISGGNFSYNSPIWTFPTAGVVVTASPYVKLTVLTLRSRARSTYSSTDMPFNFMPCPVVASVPSCYYAEVYGAGSPTKPAWLTSGMPDQLQFIDSTGANYDEPRAAEGAFVIVSDNLRAGFAEAPTPTVAPTTPGYAENGHVFRLAAKHVQGTATWWDLVDAYSTDYSHQEVLVSSGASHPKVYMIGRQLADGTKPSSSTNVTGPAQDIAVFQTIIPVQQ